VVSQDEAINRGHYAKKQLLCADWLISWSHRSRFHIGVGLAREFAGKRVLDYGCGDGTFLAMLMKDEANAPGRAVGVEVHQSLVDDCRSRFGGQPKLDFIFENELSLPEHQASYDAVFCMEVLEHVVEVEAVLGSLEKVLAPGGKLFVSVPVEIGLPLLIKQAARRAAGWRGLGDYKYTSAYTIGEYLKSVFPSARQHITRPVYEGEGGSTFHDHKGFNWKLTKEILGRRFRIEKILSSPVAALPPQLASQVWFVACKR
jgi:2-polyprenyl-3-methyl-5-hydroxy-6-metoxy-1,4-benzoquinol methylase